MGLISTSVPTLVNGVSQQAENLRFTSQCQEQINGFSSVLQGLLKRPPTNHRAQLALTSSNFQTVAINRSSTEQYMLLLGNQSLRVFDLDGTEIPVKNSLGNPITSSDLAYIQTTTPRTSLRALTVADYTILLNREKTAAMSSTVTPALQPSGLVFIKQFRQDANYTLKLYDDPTSGTADYTFTYTPAAATENQESVAQNLRALLAASPGDADYHHFHQGPLLFISKKDNSNFRIEMECSIPEGAAVFKDSAQNFSMLPKNGWCGFQLKIKGDPEDAGDDYYVKFAPQEPTASGFAEGAWEESQAFGLEDSLDPASMPHVLLNFGTYFQFKPLDWGARTCGDADTNPEPSFVGKKIRDVFFHKNRLGFLTDENLVLSESGEFFNFWRTTVIQLLDSDPIDVAASHTKISILNFAVPSNEELVLFSDQTQFKLQAADTLTPKTVSLPTVSDYDNITTVAPKALNDFIVFAFKRGASSGFIDYAVDPDTAKFKGFDVTEHVPSYLEGEVEAFDVSSLANLVVAKTDECTDTLFVYQFFKRRSERLQSAWHRWEFSGTVRSFFILGTTLHLIIERDGDYFYETMELDTNVKDANSDFTTFLDRRVQESEVTVSYNATTELTTFVLPYTPGDDLARIVQRSTSTHEGGALVPLTSQVGDTLTARGDWTTTPLWFGENYTMEMTLTRPQLREQRGDGSFVVMPGRFQVKRGFLTHSGSLAFSVEVTPQGRSTYTYTYSPRDLGTNSSITGSPPSGRDGVFPFSVLSKNDQVTIKLVNDTPLPCALLSIHWEALYTLRAQRV
jgi:hypothetical protein